MKDIVISGFVMLRGDGAVMARANSEEPWRAVAYWRWNGEEGQVEFSSGGLDYWVKVHDGSFTRCYKEALAKEVLDG